MFKFTVFLLATLFSLTNPVYSQDPQANPQRILLPDTVRPHHYKLHLIPHAEQRSFSGTLAIDVDVRATIDEITLNAVNLKLLESDLSGNKVSQVTYDTVN
ncbi:MAG: hypothetical protein KA902_06520, partial [Arenimonas sp.]|nr:hypothetical protein [Arenimonas sp.]